MSKYKEVELLYVRRDSNRLPVREPEVNRPLSSIRTDVLVEGQAVLGGSWLRGAGLA